MSDFTDWSPIDDLPTFKQNGRSHLLTRLATTPATEIMARERAASLDDEEALWADRAEGFRHAMVWQFSDGPHPLVLARRIYAAARYLDPQLLAGFTAEELDAVIFNDDRAKLRAWIDAPLKKTGPERR